jgi:hypothetical protein
VVDREKTAIWKSTLSQFAAHEQLKAPSSPLPRLHPQVTVLPSQNVFFAEWQRQRRLALFETRGSAAKFAQCKVRNPLFLLRSSCELATGFATSKISLLFAAMAQGASLPLCNCSLLCSSLQLWAG